MAQLTITVPDANVSDIAQAFTERFPKEWEAALIANPSITHQQFVRRKIADFIKTTYLQHEIGKAKIISQTTITSQIDSIVID